MKKFIACLLALLVVAAAQPAFADWGDRLEITFTIGENFVNINGAVTETLDAPYIADDLTLVPLEAIKEAFGAEVNWDGETRSVSVVREEVSEDEFCDYSIARLNISFSLPAFLAEEYFDVVSDAP